MVENTTGTNLPRKLEQKMQIVEEQIKLAQPCCSLSVTQIAERTTCTLLTLSHVETEFPTVSIGIYLRVLHALQLEGDIFLIAKDDEPEHHL